MGGSRLGRLVLSCYRLQSSQPQQQQQCLVLQLACASPDPLSRQCSTSTALPTKALLPHPSSKPDQSPCPLQPQPQGGHRELPLCQQASHRRYMTATPNKVSAPEEYLLERQRSGLRASITPHAAVKEDGRAGKPWALRPSNRGAGGSSQHAKREGNSAGEQPQLRDEEAWPEGVVVAAKEDADTSESPSRPSIQSRTRPPRQRKEPIHPRERQEMALARNILHRSAAHEVVIAIERNEAILTPTIVSQAFTKLARLQPWDRPVSSNSVRWKAVFGFLCKYLTERSAEFDAQGLANSVHAMASLRVREPAALQAMAQQVAARTHEMTPQNLANTVWAYAKLGDYNSQVFDAVSRQVLSCMRDLQPQHIANICWAFAKAGNDHPLMFNELVGAVTANAQYFLPQQMSAIVWSYATLKIECLHMFEALAREMEAQVPSLGPQAIANTAWGFATLTVADRRLFQALAEGAARHAHAMSPQQASNTLWGFATLGEVEHTDAIELVGAVAVRHAIAGRCSAQGLANLCWSLAVLDKLDPEVLLSLAPALEVRMGQLEHRGWTQVFLSELAARGKGALPPGEHVLPRSLLDPAASQWRMRRLSLSVDPQGHRRCWPVLQALASLGLYEHIQEQLGNADPPLYSDVLLSVSGKTVAVRVDSPTHHACNDHSVVLGRALLLHRLLGQAGMAVVSMPVHEWAHLQDNPREMARYVWAKIRDTVGDDPTEE